MKWLRKATFLPFILLLSAFAGAQTTAVNGSLKTILGINDAPKKPMIRISLQNFGGITPRTPDGPIDTLSMDITPCVDQIPGHFNCVYSNGSFAITVYPNSVVQPINTYYSVEFYSNGMFQSALSCIVTPDGSGNFDLTSGAGCFFGQPALPLPVGHLCSANQVAQGINTDGSLHCINLPLPTPTTPGGVFSGTCDNDLFMIGIGGDGRLICGAANTPQSYELNDTLVGSQPTLDFKNSSSVTFALNNDTANNRVQVTASAPGQLLPPPFPIPAGQSVAWVYPNSTYVPYPNEDPINRGVNEAWIPGGFIQKKRSCSLCDYAEWSVAWGNFVPPTNLPADAVVVGIYPVLIGNVNRVIDGPASPGAECGSDSISRLGAIDFGGSNANHKGIGIGIRGEFSGQSLGTNLSAISTYSCGARLWHTLNASGFDVRFTINTIALAVYYTSALVPAIPDGTLMQIPDATMTGVSVGNLTPLFTSSVTNPNTNAAISFALSSAAAYSTLMNPTGSTTGPAYTAIGLAEPPAAVTDASPITWNVASRALFAGIVTLNHATGTRALNITNMRSGGRYSLEIKQDATGGAAMTLGTGCTWKVAGGGAGAITLTSAANAVDFLQWTYDGTNCLATFSSNLN